MRVHALIEADTMRTREAEIDRWCQDCVDDGDTVKPEVVLASESVLQINARVLRENGEHVQKWGKIAVPYVRQGQDGHGLRAGADDCVDATASLDGWGYSAATGTFEGRNLNDARWPTDAVRSVARVYFDGMSDIGEPHALMKDYLDRNHETRKGQFTYSQRACKVNYLEYMIPGLDDRIVADLQDVVGGSDKIDILNAKTEAEVDHFFEVNRGRTYLLGAIYGGGGNLPGGIGVFYVGTAKDFAGKAVQMCGMILFCSEMWQFDVKPLQRAALVGGSQWVWYDWAGYGSISGWDEQTPIGKIIQRYHTTGSFVLSTIIGDGTLRRPSQGVRQVTDAEFQAALASIRQEFSGQVQALEGRVRALEGGAVVTPPPPPPAVIKRNLGGFDYADWQAAWAAGGQKYDTPRLVTTAGVRDAAPAQIYATGWTGPGFVVTENGLAPGSYVLRLHFEESWWSASGGRLQDISAQGAVVLPRFDIFAAAGGANLACVRDVPVSVGADGRFVLSAAPATGTRDHAVWVCGFELIKQ